MKKMTETEVSVILLYLSFVRSEHLPYLCTATVFRPNNQRRLSPYVRAPNGVLFYFVFADCKIGAEPAFPLYPDQLVIGSSEAELCRRINGADTVAAFDPFQHMRSSGVVLGGVDKVKARTVYGDGVG